MELDGHPVSTDDLAALALRNYGHFTSMRVEHGAVRGLSLHLDRLVHDCRVLHDADLDVDNVRRLVRRAAESLEQPVIVRVTVFDPALDLGHPGGKVEPHVLVSARPAAAGSLPAITLQTVNYQRDVAAVKHVGLFGNIHYRRTAQVNGYDDALFVDAAGQIIEGATWNVGLYDGTRILWPKADYLPGVTMRLLQAAPTDAESVSIPVSLDDVADMRAAFITNAAVGVRPVASIDARKLPGDPLFIERLQATYAAIKPEPI